MVKDRLRELLENCNVEEYKFVQEHEFMTLYLQDKVLEDLEKFAEVSEWIRKLRRNVLDIEVNIFCEGFSKAGHKLKENANLCYKIYTSVRKMQADFERGGVRPKIDDDDDLVARVRSVQFEGIKKEYISAYWKYHSVIRRYEDLVSRPHLIQSSRETVASLETEPTDALLLQKQVREAYPSANGAPPKTYSDPELASAQNTLHQMEDRKHELMLLEKSLVEMRDLFVLFSTLVMEHGSLLNLIEGNVQLASGHVSKAVQHLQTAREFSWRATANRCWCFNKITLMLVLLGILVAVAVVLALKKFLF
ncbi:syntaxin-4-like [Uranotaenia lowii]|uniref:syntaxin-4-like n=1 Tax=Uranotaenia lowii TaxID=190385 RepID=UPI00247B039F|nr:syntaxin-4-like [Uranotaenia lowii]